MHKVFIINRFCRYQYLYKSLRGYYLNLMRYFYVTLTLALSLIFGISLPDTSLAADQDVVIGVDGIVCVSCATVLETGFGKHEAVDNAKVDIGAGTVTVHLKEDASLDNDEIQSMITRFGYEVRDINRIDAK